MHEYYYSKDCVFIFDRCYTADLDEEKANCQQLTDAQAEDYVAAAFVDEARIAQNSGILSIVSVGIVKASRRESNRLVASVPHLCKIEGFDSSGILISDVISEATETLYNVVSPHSCAKKCFARTCQSFLWGRESSTEYQRDCYLFDRDVRTHPSTVQESSLSLDFWAGTPCDMQEPYPCQVEDEVVRSDTAIIWYILHSFSLM